MLHYLRLLLFHTVIRRFIKAPTDDDEKSKQGRARPKSAKGERRFSDDKVESSFVDSAHSETRDCDEPWQAAAVSLSFLLFYWIYHKSEIDIYSDKVSIEMVMQSLQPTFEPLP